MSYWLTLPQSAFYTYALRPAALNGNAITQALLLQIQSCFILCVFINVFDAVYGVCSLLYIMPPQLRIFSSTSAQPQNCNIILRTTLQFPFSRQHFLSSRPYQPTNTVQWLHLNHSPRIVFSYLTYLLTTDRELGNKVSWNFNLYLNIEVSGINCGSQQNFHWPAALIFHMLTLAGSCRFRHFDKVQ